MKPGNLYPPRVDATPEEIAQAVLGLPVSHQWEYQQEDGPVYECGGCGQKVHYPETLYRDGLCEACHTAARV